MKKVLVIIMFFLMSCGLISCGEKADSDNKDNRIKIVTTIYPEYDFVNNIIKGQEDKFNVSILMTSGVDLHNFQPSAKDILDIGKADLFIYVGGESDKWVDGALRQASNKNIKAINLIKLLDKKVKVEEMKEGMEEDEEEEEEGEECDEHVWLSLDNAIIVCEKLLPEIQSLDPVNAELYADNADAFIDKLMELDEEYSITVTNAKRNVLLFGDRFPFRYLVDDYGIEYYAAFKGCSAETEASFKTIKYLADKLGEENLDYVIKIEKSDEKIARAIIDNSVRKDAQIETMYSIQAVDSDDIKNGETYLSYMQKNLEVLKKVLN